MNREQLINKAIEEFNNRVDAYIVINGIMFSQPPLEDVGIRIECDNNYIFVWMIYNGNNSVIVSNMYMRDINNIRTERNMYDLYSLEVKER